MSIWRQQPKLVCNRHWTSLYYWILIDTHSHTHKKLFFFSYFAEPEKNFALESYGSHSKCFEHTQDMWEERSCRQTREWQHWGSGCYKYKCANGRLHILVGHVSCRQFFSYFFPTKFAETVDIDKNIWFWFSKLFPSPLPGHKLQLRMLPSRPRDPDSHQIGRLATSRYHRVSIMPWNMRHRIPCIEPNV